MTLEDVSLLSSPECYEQWEKAIQEIGAPYVDEDKVPDMEVFYSGGSSCKKGDKACCAKGKKSCCSKKGS